MTPFDCEKSFLTCDITIYDRSDLVTVSDVTDLEIALMVKTRKIALILAAKQISGNVISTNGTACPVSQNISGVTTSPTVPTQQIQWIAIVTMAVSSCVQMDGSVLICRRSAMANMTVEI
ncbi:hypothetical protein COOONC_15571 [Cooperia oncophora]